MAEIVPNPNQTELVSNAASSLTESGIGARIGQLLAQPVVKKTLPAAVSIGALAAAGLLYMALSSGPQRTLYTSLSDGERASVAAALDQGGIGYQIDNATGQITVGEDDLYRARMLVASNEALAVPDGTSELLDNIPLGASRTMEGERLRNVREQELARTIMEIDGVEGARVHLATPQRSVFVRDQMQPSASVMTRLARGRSLNEDQVKAIINLVSASVPGMSAEHVRVVDQNGKLLTGKRDAAADLLEKQQLMEAKLRTQIEQLLIPMIGEGNFSSEVQVELDPNEVTSARETYDQEGAVRSERESRATRTAAAEAGGVPGVLANTPPPPGQLEEGAPEGNQAQQVPAPTDSESDTQRSYELGREVAVTSTRPGGISRLTVAVALSEDALKAIEPATSQQVQQLVSAAVGANPERGDQVTVISGTFEELVVEETPFYEAGWFGTVLRNIVALFAVLLAWFLGVRPIVKSLKRRIEGPEVTEDDEDETYDEDDDGLDYADAAGDAATIGQGGGAVQAASPVNLDEQVELARQLAEQQPDRAAQALRRMLAAPQPDAGA